MPAVADMDKARELLRARWGYDDFRKSQVVVIDAALQGKDVLAILPTGYGKTATFQIPALVRPGGALVFSPLIALMKDQCDDAEKRGITATYVNSHVDDTEAVERLEGFVAGDYKLLYIAPERIRSKIFWRHITQARVNFIVVDEAHCASRWGHDFRPMYGRIHELVEAFQTMKGRPPIIAVTATATARIEEDIAKSLGMTEYTRIVADPVRENLNYLVYSGNKFGNLDSIMDSWDPAKGRYILYSSTRNFATTIRDILVRRFDSDCVGMYHAGMNRKERTQIQDAFKSGAKPIIVATNAFGMGIDVPNIRAVVHMGIPGTLEDYMQEAGRAGRDGLESQVIILVEPRDIDIQEYFISMSNPPARLYRALWTFLLAECPAGDMLQLTGKDMIRAMEIGNYLQEDVTEPQIYTCLNVLEKARLIRRNAAKPGRAFSITPARFTAASTRFSDGSSKAVYDALSTMIGESQGASGNPDREYVMLRTTNDEIAAKADVGAFSVTKVLKQMDEADILSVEKVYRGKTTEVLKRPKTLDGTFDFEALEHKRIAADRRLRIMVEYTQVPASQRIQYIRDYFLKKKFEDDL
jgi:ATP-dependent DNA helicase RecQ